jgi:hypothetical protein
MVKIKKKTMHLLDYDEFNIYTSSCDIENYIESLIEEGIVIKDDIYEKCISYFGDDLRNLIDSIFDIEESI